jgi:hypothetical protein
MPKPEERGSSGPSTARLLGLIPFRLAFVR